MLATTATTAMVTATLAATQVALQRLAGQQVSTLPAHQIHPEADPSVPILIRSLPRLPLPTPQIKPQGSPSFPGWPKKIHQQFLMQQISAKFYLKENPWSKAHIGWIL